MKITKLERAPEGHWTARVRGIPVTCVYGSWGTLPDAAGRWKAVTPEVAAKLSKYARRAERRERGEVEA